MLSSHERKQHSSRDLGVRDPRSKAACRQSVRHADAGGVQEQGEAASGLAWNTGDPSVTRCHAGHRSPPAYQRPGGPLPLSTADRVKNSAQTSLYPRQGFRTKSWGEDSGSLSSFIVALERWGTSDGADPWSSEGMRPADHNQCHRPRATSLR